MKFRNLGINPIFEIMLLLKFISEKIENVKEKINHYKQMKRANSRKRTYYYLQKSKKIKDNVIS